MATGGSNGGGREARSVGFVATVEEDRPVIIQKEVCQLARSGWEFVLVGKFVGQTAVDANRVRELFRRLCCPDSELRVLEEGDNVFLFKFPNSDCKEKAMFGGPWSFEDQLLLLQDWDIDRNPRDATFSDIWVGIQFRGLPLRLLHKDVGSLIGASIGEVKWVVVQLEGEANDRCLRAKVRIKTYQPLRRRAHVVTEEGDDLMVDLLYERIPKLCCWCGRLDHDSGLCSLRAKRIEENKSPDYGDWILQRQGQKRKLLDSHAHARGKAASQKKSFGSGQNHSSNKGVSTSGAARGEHVAATGLGGRIAAVPNVSQASRKGKAVAAVPSAAAVPPSSPKSSNKCR